MKFSEYSLQLREKQKLKRTYRLLESQFRRLFERAERTKGITGETLLILLERRLDNMVYRLGFANSRAEARQLVRHGHFLVNGRKVDIPSSLVKAGDVVTVRERSRKVVRIQEALELSQRRGVPEWLEVDRPNFTGRIRGAAGTGRSDDADQREARRRALLEVEGGGIMQKNWRDLIKPKKLEADEKSLTPTYGKFVGEPLERGFGTTIGNSLRRVLLSSLYGAAISAVRIRGILHEFSTIPGVTEDVTDIVLNLKEVRVKLTDGAQDTVRLSVKGEREVTAADIVTGPRVEILNPEQHIATLSKEGNLEIELVVKRGRGYVSAEHNKEEGDPVGTIPLDAIFSPVRKVNFNVTNARVGQRTDYDRLVLEVWTDGSIATRGRARVRGAHPPGPARDLHQLRGRERDARAGRGIRRGPGQREPVSVPSTSSSSPSAPRTACRTPTSSSSASWCSARSRRC